MRFVRISSFVIGMMMVFQWAFFLLTGNVPELESAPVSIIFHITIELITATLLCSTFFQLRNPSAGTISLAIYTQGMLGYTVVNSAGYFAQSGQWLFVLIFSLLLALSVWNLCMLTRNVLSTFHSS